MQFLAANARRIVIKIGTNSLAGPGGALLAGRLQAVCGQIALLRKAGLEVIIISSGAIGMGMGRLGLARRPADLPTLQACAAVGQSRLMEAWQGALQTHALTAAQILLTHEDVRGRRRHLAIRATLERLLALGVVPVVNENDTVSADEIKFGDNDVLSALVASLVRADLLVILSTIPGLLADKGKGALIPVVTEITDAVRAMAGGALNDRSTGGMVTKIEAARLATQSGCGVFIGSSEAPHLFEEILAGTAMGTFFVPQSIPLAARKRWIAFFEKPTGTLQLDAGAVAAITAKGSSLLARGVTACTGSFQEGAVATLHDPAGRVVARGIVGYDADTIRAILGLDTPHIRERLPGRTRYEVVHRDSLVLV